MRRKFIVPDPFFPFVQGLILILALLVLAACRQEPPVLLPTPEGAYEVDPIFREFYNYLGGQEILGIAISPANSSGGIKSQYTEKAQLVYNPHNPASQRFNLHPLGIQIGISEPPVNEADYPGKKIVAGHVVFDEFVTLFERLGGIRFVGAPLTEVRYDPEQLRYEQYFENLGFYRSVTKSPGDVGLLAYGAWACDYNCRESAPVDGIIGLHYPVGNRFKESELGRDLYFTGIPLSEPYQIQSGELEQIFENVVLVTSSKKDNPVNLQPLTEQLGILPDPPVMANQVPGTIFYPIQGDRGYNIPAYFKDFIQANGGFDVSGAPVTEISRLSGQVSQQCFKNLCLLYDETAPKALRVRVKPLGYTYRDMYHSGKPDDSRQSTEQDRVMSIQVWEKYPVLQAYQEQEIRVIGYINGLPAPDIEMVLILNHPVEGKQKLNFPSTNADGQTRLQLSPFRVTENTKVLYKVCIIGQGKKLFCGVRDFVISID